MEFFINDIIHIISVYVPVTFPAAREEVTDLPVEKIITFIPLEESSTVPLAMEVSIKNFLQNLFWIKGAAETDASALGSGPA